MLKTRNPLAIPNISLIFAFEVNQRKEIMGKIINKTITKIVTEEGISLFRRVTKIFLMPNGKYCYPVDYLNATPELLRFRKKKWIRYTIPVYEKLI